MEKKRQIPEMPWKVGRHFWPATGEFLAVGRRPASTSRGLPTPRLAPTVPEKRQPLQPLAKRANQRSRDISEMRRR